MAAAVKKVPAAPVNKHTDAVSSSAAKIASWNISGALAAKSHGKGWSASMNWTQRGQGNYQIRLSGPFGGGALLITKNGGLITLREGSKSVSSSNASTLMKQQTGVSLPVTSLYYWVRGIPAPGAVSSMKRDQYGRLMVLHQSGYTIEYNQYTAAGKAVLPSHIKLQGNGVFMKLVIRTWQI
jgi:outer membrane lipoprotein LolB